MVRLLNLNSSSLHRLETPQANILPDPIFFFPKEEGKVPGKKIRQQLKITIIASLGKLYRVAKVRRQDKRLDPNHE